MQMRFSGTGYEGTSCTDESPSLTFSGSQYLKYLSKTTAQVISPAVH